MPFWDDFSFQSPGYPDSLWADYETVNFTDGVAINPVSINAATFDGLKADGTPYDPNDQLATGYTDVLTSQVINMEEVPLAQRSTVYFSFFYQWRGNGEAPDPGDFLAIEFLNDVNGELVWEEIDRIEADGSQSQSVFYPIVYNVAAQYFHDEFQFRFRSHGRVSGPYDVWLVDYVYLADDRFANDYYFPDRAITSKLSTLFLEYNAVPVKHFFTSKPINAPFYELYNLMNKPQPLAYRVDATYTNIIGDVSTTTQVELGKGLPINPIAPLTRISETLQVVPDVNDPNQFNPLAKEIQVNLRVDVFTGDVTGIPGLPDIYYPRFSPVDFRANDTINTSYVLKDYYAYDDGQAEYSAYLTNEGNLLAYQFDMLTNQPDTLIGFMANFPFYGGQTSILDVFVLADDNGFPGSVLSSRFDVTLQKGSEFMFIPMEATLVSNTFYVGWVAPANRVHIGLDKNNNTGSKIFVNTNGNWVQNTNVTGSLLIRPVFGVGDVITGMEEPIKTIRAYPNPNSGSFYFDQQSRIIQIHDIRGRVVTFTTAQTATDQFITLKDATPGIYIVRATRQGKVSTTKVVVTE